MFSYLGKLSPDRKIEIAYEAKSAIESSDVSKITNPLTLKVIKEFENITFKQLKDFTYSDKIKSINQLYAWLELIVLQSFKDPNLIADAKLFYNQNPANSPIASNIGSQLSSDLITNNSEQEFNSSVLPLKAKKFFSVARLKNSFEGVDTEKLIRHRTRRLATNVERGDTVRVKGPFGYFVGVCLSITDFSGDKTITVSSSNGKIERFFTKDVYIEVLHHADPSKNKHERGRHRFRGALKSSKQVQTPNKPRRGKSGKKFTKKD